jgi:DNA mismatch repair ATPase MutS
MSDVTASISESEKSGTRGDEKPGLAPGKGDPAPAKADLSPAMRQYQQFKTQYPNYVLFFRMGDFYEMFWDDARVANKVLGVTLTSRSRGGLDAPDAIPMAGIPFHSVDG